MVVKKGLSVRSTPAAQGRGLRLQRMRRPAHGLSSAPRPAAGNRRVGRAMIAGWSFRRSNALAALGNMIGLRPFGVERADGFMAGASSCAPCRLFAAQFGYRRHRRGRAFNDTGRRAINANAAALSGANSSGKRRVAAAGGAVDHIANPAPVTSSGTGSAGQSSPSSSS